jgi:hypothetical protein
MLVIMKRNLAVGGNIEILTDIQQDGSFEKALEGVAERAGLEIRSNVGKRYFPEGWTDNAFVKDRQPRVMNLKPR